MFNPVCPACHFELAPASLFLSDNNAFFSVLPHHEALFKAACGYQHVKLADGIYGCPAMREALQPELPSKSVTPSLTAVERGRHLAAMKDIMPRFHSIGDNCEFGLVQRWAECEPLDLLRFAGFFIPVEHRLEQTIKALTEQFEGLGDLESIHCEPDGDVRPREFVVHEKRWQILYHTGRNENDVDVESLRRQQVTSLRFRRRLLFSDLEAAERIFVWKSNLATSEEDVRRLVACLRHYGPNLLLWVTTSDPEHPAGLVEYAGAGLLRGYVRRFAPYAAAGDIDHGPWHAVCRNAVALADYLAACGEWSRSEGGARFRVNRDGPLDEVSLAEVATTIDYDEREEHNQPTGPVVLGSGFPPEAAVTFTKNPGTRDIRGIRLRDAVVDTATAVWLQGDRKIRETRYMVSDTEYRNVRPVLTGLRSMFADKVVVAGFNRAFRNYYHWMMQALPALACGVRRVGADNAVLALYPPAPWEEETLDLLGLAHLPRLPLYFHHHYHFVDAFYSEFLNGEAAFFLSPRSLEVLERMSVAVGPGEAGPERIYVSRADSGRRRLTNELELQHALELVGFTIVVPGSLSIREQVRLFRGARLIVGAHGAGLTNLAFCRPGTKVIELVGSSYPNACMNRIAQARGLAYYAECFPSPQHLSGDEHNQSWSVDIDRMMAVVSRLAREMAP